jgi:hypothetical protein
MKRAFLPGLLFSCLAISLVAEPSSEKQFEGGSSGLGFNWNSCHEGDALIYVVFTYGSRPRDLGESYAEWVKVWGASTRHPKATLYRNSKDTTDLLTAAEQIYQADRKGKITTIGERVTYKEYRAFIDSQPKEYTAEALLAFAHKMREQSQ